MCSLAFIWSFYLNLINLLLLSPVHQENHTAEAAHHLPVANHAPCLTVDLVHQNLDPHLQNLILGLQVEGLDLEVDLGLEVVQGLIADILQAVGMYKTDLRICVIHF